MGEPREFKLVYKGVVYSKKNSKRIIRNYRTGSPMLISSKNAFAMEADMSCQFMKQTIGRKPIPKGVLWEIDMTFYRKDNARRDLDNQATSVLDGLVRAEVIEDDCVKVVKKLVITDGGVDKLNPRAEITLREMV